MGRPRSLAGALSAAVALSTAPASAAPPPSWPPATGPGTLFAHIGEEHLTDADGPRVLPAVVAQLARYRPVAVMTSADKSDNGTRENLEAYKRTVIAPLRAAGIPVFSATGNHDRTATPPVPGGSPGVTDSSVYRSVFADQPYPWGDAQPPAGFSPAARPVSDPDGASTRYAVDVAGTRWIFVDNSCYAIGACDAFQSPPFPDADGTTGQFAWMSAQAADAKRRGLRVFVVMHMPTQDDRPGHTKPTSQPHTMGEGTSGDNQTFEQQAAQAGVDAVFLGHIKVMQQYTAGPVPYFTDGGAGGELYIDESREQVGVDSGYWYGLRLVRSGPGGITTDAVPVIVPGGISVSGPARVDRGREAAFSATARQPATAGVKVGALELRDPDPRRANARKLPVPARIWTTDDPLVLAPVAAARDDARRDAATQTVSGRFAGRCPGRTVVSVTSGFESRGAAVTVASGRGAIVRAIRRRGRVVRAGRSASIAAVRLAQPARLLVRVTRAGRPVADLSRRCVTSRRAVAVRWDGRAGLRRPRPGRYAVEVRVASDRPTVVRRFGVVVRG